MNKSIILLLLSFLTIKIQAQYYYKDVVANIEANTLNAKVKQAKVIATKVRSIEFDDSETEDFLCEQEIENNAKHIFTTTGSPFTGENHLHSFYTNQSQLLRSVDSNPTIVIQNNYEYKNNLLQRINITSFVPGSREKTLESHSFIINTKNQYEKMYVIKNINDTTSVLFKLDTINNVITDEIVTYKGREKERYYYYYDNKKRLTDVVKYHPYKKKLLPEVILEYNEDNTIAKKTSYVSGTKDFQIWIYKYDTNGLKTMEQCYLRGNMFRGKLVYKYIYEK